ncbi:tripartite tricarboxylate transporter substrate binding protein [Polynucleobacter sp. UB-Siik-W21]|uniref:Bug family tripartite tricarboxylate transporter substrate binding protein n=1 Tax=Polynucleobacter sp. UB-Siik-W21 TaxID=1855646 RepID=UPI001BFD8FCC|nr:tripartite tricarboxylate transporter substrate binding protein [Polynucleobacter sp. UB-Siik-W21]QWD70017.1 tripartite tricarboxylate transporter substrate binding protein [Polynucleobacter sp. UB-Siik-W21]
MFLKPNLQKFLICLCVYLVGTSWALAQADSFPSKSIRLVVPYPPGGGTDTLMRIIVPPLTEIWKQSIVIENKPGASGAVGADAVIRSPADGYTWLIATPALPDQLVNQLAPVSLVSASPYVLTINPSLKVNTVQQLIAAAKANPQLIRFGSSGSGSVSHLSGELFKSMAGVEMLHVPYKGSGPALSDLLGGHINVMFSPAQTVMPQIQAGNLKALAVTSPKRSQSVPELPTISENGIPGYSAVGWFGIFVPSKTPNNIVSKISADIDKVLKTPQVRKEMVDRGIEPSGGTSEEFAELIKTDQQKWSKLIQDKNIKID